VNELSDNIMAPADTGTASLTQPLIVPVQLAPGLRAYSLGQYDPCSIDVVQVTGVGHWWHVSDPADQTGNGWTCHGCRAQGETGLDLDAQGRCPNPPSQQDIASALYRRQAVAL
jgi:hypothetical protein